MGDTENDVMWGDTIPPSAPALLMLASYPSPAQRQGCLVWEARALRGEMPLLTFLTRPGATVGDESSDAGARRRSRGLCAPGATWRPQSTQTLAPGTCKCDLILKIRSSQRGEGQSGVTCVLVRKGNLDVTYREKMRERGRRQLSAS